MRVLRVHARPFGPFRDETLMLRPGMNVIFGPNEAGKSSWHAAIFAGLCGLRRARGRRQKEDQAFVDRHRPWSGDAWEVEIDLELNDGRRVQLVQDLADRIGSRAIDLITGTDVAREIMHDGSPDGALYLGLTRDILPETICIRQADVLRVHAGAEELQDFLQRAAAAGGSDETAETAITGLTRFRAERVGARRRNATKPLQATLTELAAADKTLDAARAAHQQRLELVQRCNDAERERQRAELSLRAGEQARAQRDRAEVERAVECGRELSRRFPDGQPARPAARMEQLERVTTSLTSFDGRPAIPPPLAGPTAADLEQRLDGLPAVPEGDLEVAGEVARVAENWRTARHEVAAVRGGEPAAADAPESGGLDSAGLRETADRLDGPAPTVDPRDDAPGRAIGWWFGGFALTAGGALVAALGPPDWRLAGLAVLGVGLTLLLVQLLRSVTRRPTPRQELAARQAADRQLRETARARAEAAGLPANAAELRRLARALDDADAVQRARARWSERLDRSVEAERHAEGLLRDAVAPRLAAPPATDEATVDALLDRYRAECDERRAQARLAGQRGQLDGELHARRAAEQAALQARRRREAAETGLRQVAGKLDVAGDDVEQVARSLRAFADRARDEIGDIQHAREDWAAMQATLHDRRLVDLEQELERLGSTIDDALDTDDAPPAGADLDALVAERGRLLADARSRSDSLAGQLVARERAAPDVAVAEEAVGRLRQELDRIESLDRVLGDTLKFLEAARDRVQRDIAPRLSGAIERRLPRITDGGYDEVLVDPADLEVRVRPRGGEWQRATLLSHGTAEQVYLLLRLALAEQLVDPGETAPLLLDDVTVQSDAERSVAFLDLLHEISRDRQVVLFSQELEVRAWAEAQLESPGDQLVELRPRPGGTPPTRPGPPRPRRPRPTPPPSDPAP